MQHTQNELAFWQPTGLPNPFVMALVLWGLTGDVDEAEAVVEYYFTNRQRK